MDGNSDCNKSKIRGKQGHLLITLIEISPSAQHVHWHGSTPSFVDTSVYVLYPLPVTLSGLYKSTYTLETTSNKGETESVADPGFPVQQVPISSGDGAPPSDVALFHKMCMSKERNLGP